jgi:hypothetical protein
MNAEFFLFGKRIDMAHRARRRWLVALVYAGFAALLAGFWFESHWHLALFLTTFASVFVNRFLLGGRLPGGLVKPFQNKRRYSYKSESSLDDFLRWGLHRAPEPGQDTFRSDERELRERDRAHFQAYGTVESAAALLAFALFDKIERPEILSWIPAPSEPFIYYLAMVILILFATLPQAILLWTEPDMEEESPIL